MCRARFSAGPIGVAGAARRADLQAPTTAPTEECSRRLLALLIFVNGSSRLRLRTPENKAVLLALSATVKDGDIIKNWLRTDQIHWAAAMDAASIICLPA